MLGAFLLLILGCQTAEGPRGVPVDEVMQSPGSFLGQEMYVSGEYRDGVLYAEGVSLEIDCRPDPGEQVLLGELQERTYCRCSWFTGTEWKLGEYLPVEQCQGKVDHRCQQTCECLMDDVAYQARSLSLNGTYLEYEARNECRDRNATYVKSGREGRNTVVECQFPEVMNTKSLGVKDVIECAGYCRAGSVQTVTSKQYVFRCS